MTTTPITAPESTNQKALRVLAWLVFANIVFAVAAVAIAQIAGLIQPIAYRQIRPSPWLQAFFFTVGVFGTAIVGAQAVALGILAALIPQRRFLGLFLATSAALALGAISWLGMAIRSPSTTSETLPIIWAQCLALGVFVLAQGLRLLLGWRLQWNDEPLQYDRSQFGTADLIEWMISIGFFLGLGSVCGWYHNLRLLGMLLAWHAGITLPLAFTILSPQGLTFARLLVVVSCAVVATAIYHSVSWYFVPLRLPTWMLASQVLTPFTCYLFATGVNVGIIRRLGFHWSDRRRGSEAS